jgi:hypothetical protein
MEHHGRSARDLEIKDEPVNRTPEETKNHK